MGPVDKVCYRGGHFAYTLPRQHNRHFKLSRCVLANFNLRLARVIQMCFTCYRRMYFRRGLQHLTSHVDIFKNSMKYELFDLTRFFSRYCFSGIVQRRPLGV